MRYLLIVTVAVLTSTAADAQTVPTKMTPDAKKKFEAAMRNTLKDPFSTKYRGIVVAKNKQTGDYTFCGYVNSKNSFGAYTGDRLFVAMTQGEIAEASLSDGQPMVDNHIRKLCGQRGLRLD